ncbi:MAG: hypothetical protein JHD07_02035 [Bradyrhizobium sp.]|nr:hypothetical protein [Bradyrhizobium sp.]
MLPYEVECVGLQFFRVSASWRRTKQIFNKVSGRGLEDGNIGAAVQILEAVVEVPLELIDRLPVMIRKGHSISKLIETVKALDQEVQAALAVIDVELQQQLCPRWQALGHGSRFPTIRCAMVGTVDGPRLHRPNVDGFRDHACELRLRGNAAKASEQVGDEGAKSEASFRRI